MAEKDDKISPAQKLAVEALGNQGEDRRERLLKGADELRKDMERQSLHVRDLILAQPPLQLLGYLWGQLHIGVLADLRAKGEDYRPNKDLLLPFQFALEYVHAVWSCHTQLVDEKEAPGPGKGGGTFRGPGRT